MLAYGTKENWSWDVYDTSFNSYGLTLYYYGHQVYNSQHTFAAESYGFTDNEEDPEGDPEPWTEAQWNEQVSSELTYLIETFADREIVELIDKAWENHVPLPKELELREGPWTFVLYSDDKDKSGYRLDITFCGTKLTDHPLHLSASDYGSFSPEDDDRPYEPWNAEYWKRVLVNEATWLIGDGFKKLYSEFEATFSYYNSNEQLIYSCTRKIQILTVEIQLIDLTTRLEELAIGMAVLEAPAEAHNVTVSYTHYGIYTEFAFVIQRKQDDFKNQKLESELGHLK